MMLVMAAREWRSELGKKSRSPYYDDREPLEPEVEVTTGEEAEAVADVPQLDGDPENDAIELAETQGDVDWARQYEAYLKEKRSA